MPSILLAVVAIKLINKDDIKKLMDSLKEDNGNQLEASKIVAILKSYTGYKNDFANYIKFDSTKDNQSRSKFSFISPTKIHV